MADTDGAKAIFIDCNQQLGTLWPRALSPQDPPIHVNYEPFDKSRIAEIAAGFPIIIVDHSYFPAELLERCVGLKHIVFLGTGAASYIDMAAAERLGISVDIIKNYGDTAVAEHTIALMFAAARQVALMDREIRQGTWVPRAGVQLLGKTLGLLGLGGIGREVARIARGMGMEVVAWNRSPVAGDSAEMLPLEEVLERADVLSLHMAFNDETNGFLDAVKIARMKPGALLVNTARGGLVAEFALLEALRTGHIAHAALDVFHSEPLKGDHPLTGLDNVTLTAHCAFRTPEASINLLRRGIELAARAMGR